MSDYRERACHNCGSLLHHEDNCPKEKQKLRPALSGEQLRDAGMALAIESQDKKAEKWSERCYALLLQYIRTTDRFTTEQFRAWVKDKIETPDEKRAFGGIVMRCARAGFIKKIGYDTATDPLVHKNVIAVWKPTAVNQRGEVIQPTLF